MAGLGRQVVTKGDTFSGLILAARGRRGGDPEVIYFGCGTQVWDFKTPRSLVSLMSHRRAGSGVRWSPQTCRST